MTDQTEQPKLAAEPSGEVPAIDAEEPNSGATMLHGITKMIVPTIMMASQGGFIAVIPGVGLKAASSMEEIMAFVEVHAMKHFEPPSVRSELPKVLMKGLQRATSAMGDGVKKVDALTILVVAAGVSVGWMAYMGGFGVTNDTIKERLSHSGTATDRPPVFDYYRSSESPRSSGEALLPEVHVRRVFSAPVYGGAERPVRDWNLR